MMRGRMRANAEFGGATAYFAMFRWTKMSPGREAVKTDSGTRESAQPIQSTCQGEGRDVRTVHYA